jgi:hypothetical protein
MIATCFQQMVYVNTWANCSGLANLADSDDFHFTMEGACSPMGTGCYS